MYRTIQQTLLARIQTLLQSKYEVTLNQLAVEQPPSVAMGELALPVAFELAKRLRKAPRAIATELAAELMAGLESLPGVASVEVAGAGYLNVRLDRAAMVGRIAADEHADLGGPGFRLIEHTSINPNKAAHIGHLRNAILGDTFQRLLRKDEFKTGYDVGVQNYIDNTGVQVADVVVGFTELLGLDLDWGEGAAAGSVRGECAAGFLLLGSVCAGLAVVCGGWGFGRAAGSPESASVWQRCMRWRRVAMTSPRLRT